MRSRSYGLVVDESGTRMLLLGAAGEWQIPRLDADELASWAVVGGVNRGFGDLLGLEVTTLRCLSNTRVDDESEVRFFELEAHGSGDGRVRGEWLARDELSGARLAEPEHLPTLLRCLAERGDDGGPFRLPWARPGWLAEATEWIRERLRRLDLEPVVIEQERTWSISTLLRADTARGPWFFKAVPLVFASEPALTLELGRHHPGRVPNVAAADAERRWLLMEAFRGRSLEDDGDLAALADALGTYARMQIEWIDRADDLLALGCADRRLEALEPELDRALLDTEALRPDLPNGLSRSEVDAVPALRERLRAACERLRTYALPATLEHGDLHTGNIVVTGDGLLIYDWSDGCLSVPFFSLVPLFEFGELSELPHDREVLRAAYLGPWRDHVGAERLEDAFELSLFVGLFHHAVSYYRIVERTEPRARWEWERAFPWLVRKLLEHDAAR